jgi:hypothetical protein
MENLRKQNETEIENTMEGTTAEKNKWKTEFQNLKMKLKRKTEELLVKQLKTCERNMQEPTDSIKRPNLRIMGIEEGEEVQAKEIHNIFSKIKKKNSHSSTGSLFPFRDRKPPGHQTDLTKIELPHDILSLKQQAQRIEKEY